MSVNVSGLITITGFYIVIFLIGIWAAWKRKNKPSDSDEVMLAGRSIGMFVGLLTLTATWVGGGYINGSAEAVFKDGLVWCQAPFGYAISLFFSGLFFARPMRDAGYVTMLDPLQEVYGRRCGSVLYFPALAGEVLWSAAILSALGTTLAIILDIDETIAVIASAAIAVSYTLFGGLASVAYTDVAQLGMIFVGLWLAIPFSLSNEAVGSLALNSTDWLGSIPSGSYQWGLWTDYYILLIFGGIPWQVYFQRVLSARNSRQAQILSYAAAVGCVIMVIPACLIGAIAKATDWEMTSYNNTLSPADSSLVLPLVMHHLTPEWVAFIGLGAVSAAVMSSADSSVLSASSMFARNLYKNVFRQKASEKEQVIVMRCAIVVIASISCTIAIKVKSVYGLFNLCGDLVYVMLFPQLTAVVHFPNRVNIHGSSAAYVVGFLIRILGGEKLLGIPAVIIFPWYDYDNDTQLFPFRTLAMVVTFVVLISASWLKEHFSIPEVFRKTSETLVINSGKTGIDNLGMKKTEENGIKLSSL